MSAVIHFVCAVPFPSGWLNRVMSILTGIGAGEGAKQGFLGVPGGVRAAPYIHYQNDFSRFCTVYLAFAKLGLKRLMPYCVDPDEGGECGIRLPFRVVFKALRMAGLKVPSRRNLIKQVSGTDRGVPHRVADIINHINFRQRG